MGSPVLLISSPCQSVRIGGERVLPFRLRPRRATKAIRLIVIAILLAGAGCDRTGLSRPFRKSAEHALELLREAEAGDNAADVGKADGAIAEAKAKVETRPDLQLVEVLDWYDILLHRHDRARTRTWRQLCATEVQLYLEGEQVTKAQIANAEVQVGRGACQAAFFQMIAEDCRLEGRSRSECEAAAAAGRETTSLPAP